MAIFSAVRSYRNVLVALFVLSLLTTACKKSGGNDPVIDPREQYIGTYEGGQGAYNSAITIGTLTPAAETGPASITVTKSTNPKEIYIDIGGRPPRLTAELTGANFTIVDRTKDQIVLIINGQRNVIEGNYTATGVFGKDQASGKDAIVINTTTEALQLGTTVRRVETITGNRK